MSHPRRSPRLEDQGQDMWSGSSLSGYSRRRSRLISPTQSLVLVSPATLLHHFYGTSAKLLHDDANYTLIS